MLQLGAAERVSDKASACQVFLPFQGLNKGTFLVYLLLLSSKHIIWEATTNSSGALEQRQWAAWPMTDVIRDLSEGVDEF